MCAISKAKVTPLFSQEERVYMVQAVRYVTQAHLTSGWGWMDAEPEITQVIRPQLYAVNEDGDVPEKRGFLRAARA
jgi:glycerol-3-phosphate cytidylyltransferase-like family protein